MKHLFTLLLLIVLSAHGTDYYVSPAGSDANDGSVGSPFQTVAKGASVAVSGDTVRVQSGHYTQTNLTLRTSGTPASPITFLADGNVTNNFGFAINTGVSNIVISGFRRYGNGTTGAGEASTYLAYLRKGTKHITITNCISSGGLSQWGYGGGGIVYEAVSSMADPSTGAQFCTIISNRFDTITNTTVTDLHGVGHLVHGNVYANLYACDALRLFGSNTVIRANYFTNIGELSGYGNHPDITQTFGNNGHWMVDFIFEQNYIVDCPVQLMQYEQTGVTNFNLWGITLRNNVFEDSNMQCSIDVPNVRFYNNTFYKCSNGGGLFAFAFYDPGSSGDAYYRGSAYGGVMMNNAFVECSGLYSVVNAGPDQGELTTAAAGGGGRTGSGYVRIDPGSGEIRIWGTYTGLSAGVSNGVLAVVGGNDMYSVPATNFVDGEFDYTQDLVEGVGGYSIAYQYDRFNSYATAFRINTSNYVTGEVLGNVLQFVITPASDLITDFNFACGANGAAFGGFSETHGVNGGDAAFTSTNTHDFTPSVAA